MADARNDFVMICSGSFRRVCCAMGWENVCPFNKKIADGLVVLIQHTYFKIPFLEATAFLCPTLMKHAVILCALREECFC